MDESWWVNVSHFVVRINVNNPWTYQHMPIIWDIKENNTSWWSCGRRSIRRFLESRLTYHEDSFGSMYIHTYMDTLDKSGLVGWILPFHWDVEECNVVGLVWRKGTGVLQPLGFVPIDYRVLKHEICGYHPTLSNTLIQWSTGIPVPGGRLWGASGDDHCCNWRHQ